MQNSHPKRLIEVDLPIARISAHARRENLNKALSWENLHFDLSAYVPRYYPTVVFFELVV
jgi:hypothetical protein